MKKKLQVEAIAHGTVIDHVPAGQGIKILKFFQLSAAQERITVGLNLPSGEQQQKDLIKVENTVFDENQANQLALFAPNATINLIEDFEVVRKFHVSTPDYIKAVFACPNSNCISHNEPIDSHFYVRHQKTDIKLKCHYCEKSFDRSLFSELD
ncbi:aspartate carbamoyltransferase regulatory subunit [Agarivorans sp. MS3-6]|uniref:aspartate carbamoyltransferase regulatory subunit n=1 Tax=Agarivorans sp. TSD2052 TaxID=2937286 RepID=UPI00200F2640|nr:aspartate carbamoyltransferase regulatory subunit [Agarivorans sp. TSD2052]UPW18282.1 aspartate carbamoyltransferase regulatory subunit [Agarivorans sp. TSD2052]